MEKQRYRHDGPAGDCPQGAGPVPRSAPEAAYAGNPAEAGDNYRQIVELSPDAVFVHADGKVVFANAAMVRLMGAEKADQLIGMTALNILHPEARDRVRQIRSGMARTHEPVAFRELRFVTLDGKFVEVESGAAPVLWEGRKAISVVARDISDRKRAEREFAEKSAMLQSTFESMGQGFCVFDSDGRLAAFNRKYIDIFQFPAGFIRLGMSHEEVVRRMAEQNYLGDGEVEEIVRSRVASARSGEERTNENTLPDGATYLYHRRPMPNGGFVVTYTDITERKRADAALRESDHRYRELINLSPDGIMVHVGGKIVFANPTFADLLGAGSPEQVVGRAAIDFIPEGDREAVFARRAAAGSATLDARETEYLRFDGALVPVERSVARITWQGEPAFLVLARNISERKQAEEALRESERNLRTAQSRLIDAINSLPIAINLFDAENRLLVSNMRQDPDSTEFHATLKPGKRFEDIARESAYGGEIAGAIGREEEWLAERIAYFNDPKGSMEVEYTDGRCVQIINRRTSEGGSVGIRIDVTAERKREELLRQSQKMEAVGQLTGGVAHDFNNLLAVISGNAELLEGKIGETDDSIEAIYQAITRGSELTQRLLAFSRRQPLQPQSIDLGDLVSNISGLLSRTLGETIAIATGTVPGLWAALADPGQVENAILNLAINARDAMPGGGKLSIECANVELGGDDIAEDSEVEPGEYVMLAVRDTGVGMSPDTLTHAFEPFFTTKEVGKGSGLGLSMVYGFARQSGGHVSIASEEGRGTTVRLYLPRAKQSSQRETAPKKSGIPQGGGEIILVIEDDLNVRRLVVKMLDTLGYRVVEVSDAASAEKALANGTKFDLVLSDVVLPGGTSGPEFVRAARTRFPDLKVIFMSGYPAEAAKSNGALGADQMLLNKPFRMRQLAKALRDTLD